MAKTEFTSSHVLTVQHWAADTFRYGTHDNFFNKFVGKVTKRLKGVVIETDDNAMITKKTEFRKNKKGDKVTFALIEPLTGEGKVDDARLEDSEEAIVARDFSVTLRRRRHATRTEGEMSDRRPAFDIQAKSRGVLGLWLARVHDVDQISVLSGLANAAGTIAATAPTTNRGWAGGQTTADALQGDSGLSATIATLTTASNYLFGPRVVEAVKRAATLSEPIIRPIMVGGEEFYLMFIHLYQAKALKASTDWKAAMQNAARRGPGNPLFTGALAEWDGVIIHEIPKIETRLGAGGTGATEVFETGVAAADGVTVARALFCGAQASVIAYGGVPMWVEEKFDYDNEWGIALSLMYVTAKTKFNNEDYGVMTVDTAVQPD